MAIIKKKIENLKPGKEYVLTVRAKNSDLNVLSDYSDSIRFQVPNDATTPSALSNLRLFSGLENVMFVFDYSEDLDVSRYEYELYQNSNMSDEGGPLTGFADANVFTVRVSNLQLEEDGGGLAPFWGRARTIDTTGNAGPWTSIVETDPHTPLIDNQYIGSLTVSKLTAGTIGSHTINLNGINSIIQSTTYQDTFGAQGWQIRGDGHFSLGGPNGITYDNDSITIGSDVSVTATLAADSIIVGTIPNQLKINGAINSGAGGMTLGDPTDNYWYSNGRFRVGSASKYMQWNGTDLSVTGTINATAGYFSGDVTIGSGPGSTTLNAIEASSIDFNSRNNRNSTTPTNPTINSDGTAIDHVINGNGSADISFEWIYTYTDTQNAANNIDGFVIYVYSSDSSTPHTFGTDDISFESTYPVDSDRRAIVLSGVSANKYYTFGIKAYRVVDRDISASEILYSSIVQPTRTEEKPYRPSSTIAFTGDITGTINGTAAATVVAYATAGNTVATNFNNNNDRNGTTPPIPTIPTNNTAIDHVLNTDGSVDVTFLWNEYSASNGINDSRNIDGFIVYVRSSTSATSYTFGTTPAQETTYYLPRDKKVFILPGVAADRYYNFGIRAYRMVDTDIISEGIVYSLIAQSAGAGENPYRPEINVAFNGNITGFINGIAAATVIEYANAGNTIATNFNTNNDRNNTTPTAPTLPSSIAASLIRAGSTYTILSVGNTSFTSIGAANNTVGTTFTANGVGSGTGTVSGETIDHVLNTDGSVDISFEWLYTTSDVYNVANNIDGFIVYVRSSTNASAYSLGAEPSEETTYYLPRDKRAFILPAVAADRHYTFGVRAYRMVDTDINGAGIIYSSIVKSTVTGENPYQPSSTVAFAGNITGTVNSVAVTTITTTVSNFNNNNDRISTTPATPTSVAFSTATSNTNASIDLPLNWTFTGTGDAYNIDGFVVFLRTTTVTNSNDIITSDLNTNIQQIYLTAEKRSHTFSGISPSSFYRAAVRAYRVVNTDINSAGVIYGPLVNTTERDSAIATIGGSSGIKIGDGKIYIGTNPGAFNNSNTGFYVDSISQFSLGNKLKWGDLTNAGSFTVGKLYSIVSLGNTTQAQWNTTAGTTGITYAIGSTFTAATAGAGSGTASLQQLTIAGDVLIGSTPGSTIASGAASGSTSLQPGGAASDVNNNTTTISGSKIRTGVIESTGYTYSSGNFSTAGMQIDLGNGVIRSKNFGIDSSGNAFFNGQVTAISGILGGWNIGIVDQNGSGALSGALYNGSGSSLSAIAPGGWAWFSSRIITPLISGYASGTKSSGGIVADMFLRNIQYGGGRPSGGSIGDIYLS